MKGDFFFMKVLAICGSEEAADLLRQAAGVASITVDLSNVTASGANHALAKEDFDVVFVDGAIAEAEQNKVIVDARSCRSQPFIFLLAVAQNVKDSAAANRAADGSLKKPRDLAGAKALIESCTHLKVPSSLLMVDDSSTMRSIVRKVLERCRFPLEISESADGEGALNNLGAAKFDFVLLDYYMPGLNGLELLNTVKRQYPRTGVIMMTASVDEALAERVCAAGAAAFLKKPFYPADIDTVFYSSHGFRFLA